ncbi:MAG: ATP-dependent DNA helicase RecG [Thiobacillaceae bacterium]
MSQTSAFPVSDSVRAKLDKLGIARDLDLILHLPLRWEDETRIVPIRDLRPAMPAQIQAAIEHAEISYKPRRTLHLIVADESGQLAIRFLNFYPSQVKEFQPGSQFRFNGEVRGGMFGLEMVHPRYRRTSPDAPLPQALTPVYPTTAGLSQTTLRRLIEKALGTEPLSETLPEAMLRPLSLPTFDWAVRALHHPPPDLACGLADNRSHPAFRRLIFDELLAQQLSLRQAKKRQKKLVAPALKAVNTLAERLLALLPFRLTAAQEQVWKVIRADLTNSHPMRRLLQGDVGSGKTVVAALACLQAVDNGWQAALMAPTEILAEQHYRKFAEWLAPLGVSFAWLSSSLARKDKFAALHGIASGEIQIALGTHALFQNDVVFHRLGLTIVDEQHRFGVAQRLALQDKGKTPHPAPLTPHVLMMSATPIPRTLAMSYYADLDVSVIDELPPGRTPVVTKLVSSNRRDEVLARVRRICQEGGQAYWVCPLIEESDKLQLQTALDTHATLRAQLPELSIGLIHGRMKAEEKNAAMAGFKSGVLQLLVATTVIEVGVDVPNASLMAIEHAERMGLAQLHQLRGRVGRGSRESVCVLLYQEPLGELARARLKIIYESTDGFEIARKDLLLRGPGELLGARQSGVPLLRFADPEHDTDLLEVSARLADTLLKQSPDQARQHLIRWFGERQQFERS